MQLQGLILMALDVVVLIVGRGLAEDHLDGIAGLEGVGVGLVVGLEVVVVWAAAAALEVVVVEG